MSLIDIKSANIDFEILQSKNPKYIYILDTSTYLDKPDKPSLHISFPAFTGYINIPYTPNYINIISSDSLGITNPHDYDEKHSDLPDGVYSIKMTVCPHDKLYKEKYYLKSSYIEKRIAQLLLKINKCIMFNDEAKKIFMNIFILLESAKVEAGIGNYIMATEKYKNACDQLNSLEKILNCK